MRCPSIVKLLIFTIYKESQDVKYSDYTSFFSLNDTLNKQSFLSKVERKDTSALYYKTILKHIKLSHLIYNASKLYNID